MEEVLARFRAQEQGRSQVQQTLQELRLRGERAEDALHEQQQRSARAEAELQAAAAQLQGLRAAQATVAAAVAAAAATAAGGNIVGTRAPGGARCFSGRREAWREFRFVLEAIANATCPGMPSLFRQAEAMSGRPIDANDLDQETTALSRQLYYMLVRLTTDDATA